MTGARWHLTHWARVTYIGVGKLTIIDSDNGLLPGWCQTIIWTSAAILLTGPLLTNFIEILIGIQTFSFKKMHLKMSSEKWRPFCLGLNVLKTSKKHPIWSSADRVHNNIIQNGLIGWFLGFKFVSSPNNGKYHICVTPENLILIYCWKKSTYFQFTISLENSTWRHD